MEKEMVIKKRRSDLVRNKAYEKGKHKYCLEL